jgi:hypothetical protein
MSDAQHLKLIVQFRVEDSTWLEDVPAERDVQSFANQI